MRKPLPSPREVAAPPGWRASELHDPFEAHVGPLFEREEEGERIFGFIVDERHVSADGTVHEGMMLTFADAFLGSAAHRGADHKSCVTLSMQASFLKGAKPGDLVECRTKLERKTRAIIFVSARFSVGDEDVMTATSLWKVLGER
ncbi:PaaI family thioesterase [Parvibaculum sp.]|uniref:PaaI family thioesterase n=1 Tax=Parvibaculum sp. TaxID=2024848 RepID=UPI001B2F5FA6|nr:PaaI family thioesterase [Parvibaculum sp.]MBO6633321.1 PaaI family thioesterase [Parvibaculum sp.]MBO6678159.1 PaaI family thioesterase [Parvibaculum sp.]MBO6683693.1 PaaI family thioesterase [Parvibaculum sp.]MBO6906338.1 PaaI family thioesterase [Parvibaculum sp.]